MKVCNEIKRQIDEADDLQSVAPEVARHMAACIDCRRFADERAALRALIASTARVNAPVNFDAVLTARLAEVKADRRLAWLNLAFYLRLGAATALLTVAVFVAQYKGLFNVQQPTPFSPTDEQSLSGLIANAIGKQLPDQYIDLPVSVKAEPPTVEPRLPGELAVSPGGGRVRPAAGRGRGPAVPMVTPDEVGMDDVGAVLIPGRNGEHDITVPTVSVGAQPLVYVNAGRQPQPGRAVPVSF